MPSLQRCFTVVLCVLTFTVLIPSTVMAITIPPAGSDGATLCGTTQFGQYQNSLFAASFSLSCDFQYADQWGSVQAVGLAYTSLAPSVLADVVGHTSATGEWVGIFSAYADAEYYMLVNQIATPPMIVDTIPMFMIIAGETSVQGSGTAESKVGFGLPSWQYPGLNYNQGKYYALLNSVTYEAVQLNLIPGTAVYQIDVSAACEARANNGYSECQAVTDPVFQFDQATFDAQMGGNTFPLASYYVAGFSPNLTLTPEPSSAILIATGMLGLAYAVRRRRVAPHRDLDHPAS